MSGLLWRKSRAEKLGNENGGFCLYCDLFFTRRNPATVDHMTPISRGGPNHRWNLAPACEPCNSAKSGRSWAAWTASLSEPHRSRCLRYAAAAWIRFSENESPGFRMDVQPLTCAEANARRAIHDAAKPDIGYIRRALRARHTARQKCQGPREGMTKYQLERLRKAVAPLPWPPPEKLSKRDAARILRAGWERTEDGWTRT